MEKFENNLITEINKKYLNFTIKKTIFNNKNKNY